MPARDHFRAHARHRVDLEGRLRTGESVSLGVRLRDLGLGGACVELVDVTAPALDVEGPIALEVTAPSLWDPLILPGKVAWMRRIKPERRVRVGLRFELREVGALRGILKLLG
jgi:PilZ domain